MTRAVNTAAVGIGGVIQVVQGTYATQTATSGSATSTGLSTTITPTSASSKILVIANISAAYVPAGSQGSIYLAKNGSVFTPIVGQMFGNASAVECNMNITWLDSPGTTAATTYAVFFAANSGTFYVHLNGTTSTITLMEIAG